MNSFLWRVAFTYFCSFVTLHWVQGSKKTVSLQRRLRHKIIASLYLIPEKQDSFNCRRNLALWKKKPSKSVRNGKCTLSSHKWPDHLLSFKDGIANYYLFSFFLFFLARLFFLCFLIDRNKEGKNDCYNEDCSTWWVHLRNIVESLRTRIPILKEKLGKKAKSKKKQMGKADAPFCNQKNCLTLKNKPKGVKKKKHYSE